MRYDKDTKELFADDGTRLCRVIAANDVFVEWLIAREAFIKELTLAAFGEPDNTKLVTTANVFAYVSDKLKESK